MAVPKKKNKVGAPVGNKNAEVWDIEAARSLYLRAIELTNETDQYLIGGGKTIPGYKYDFIGEIAAELKTFREIFSHLLGRFGDELQDLSNQLNTNIERNCYSNTKKGLIKEATGIVNLKSNWKWTDRQQMDHTGIPKIPIIKFADDNG